MARITLGAGALLAAALILNAALRRIARGVAALFAGVAVFVVGSYLVLSGLWRLLRSRRRARGPSDG